jgi:uncharacterized protein VirK/YbjX
LTLLFVGRKDRSVIKDKLKLALGAVVYPVQTRRWRDYVNGNAVLAHLARQYPKILHKIYRPYLDTQLSCSGRVDVLIAHYDRIAEAGLTDFVERAAMFPTPVAEFSGKTGTRFALQLSAINDGHREGELTLKLLHEGNCIYTSSFTLVTSHGVPSIAIGALQGLRSAHGAQAIKAATRELHGCRPKKLMVSAVRAVGDCFDCASMVLVSNQNLVTINGRRASRISSNYDETWQEMGALRGQDGNFHLPCSAEAHDLDAVASHKRAEARRRQDLIASMSASIRIGVQRRVVWTPASIGRCITVPHMSSKDAPCANDARIDLLIG